MEWQQQQQQQQQQCSSLDEVLFTAVDTGNIDMEME
jgi:hypothetical protein